MVLVDADTHSEHVQVVKWDVELGSAGRSKDVENGWFQKKSKGYIPGASISKPDFIFHLFLRL
jgi:hypothetical protein